MATIIHKRRNTFVITNYIPLAFGSTLTSIRSQIRRGENLVYDLSPSIEILPPTDTEYVYRFSAPSSATENWPIRELLCDIEYRVGVNIASTETFIIDVERNITTGG